jgi:hypothetical protein
LLPESPAPIVESVGVVTLALMLQGQMAVR